MDEILAEHIHYFSTINQFIYIEENSMIKTLDRKIHVGSTALNLFKDEALKFKTLFTNFYEDLYKETSPLKHMYFNLLIKGYHPPQFHYKNSDLNILYSYGKDMFNNMFVENDGCVITGNGSILNGDTG